jgi:hypothetical protein
VSKENTGRNMRWSDRRDRDQEFNVRTVLKSGSYLNSFCPHCGESLMHNNMIHLEMVSSESSEGWVDLSPYLNVYERTSDTRLPEGQEVQDLRCWHCHKSLRSENMKCEFGDSHIALVLVGISTVRVPFYFCMREGCHWHKIDPDDEHKIILDDSDEW